MRSGRLRRKITRATSGAVAILLLLLAPVGSAAAGQPDRSPGPVSDAALARWALQAPIEGTRNAPVSRTVDASASQPASVPVLPGYTGPRDANGVVMSKYSYFSYPVYNPVHVAEWASTGMTSMSAEHGSRTATRSSSRLHG